MIYAIAGSKGHGKDTFANTIRSFNAHFEVKHFADLVKEQSMEVFGLTRGQVYDEVLKDKPLPRPIDMDCYLGSMRLVSGLDLQAADCVANTPREVLQYYGTEYVRRAAPNYWVDTTLQPLTHGDYLIPDCRFPNEVEGTRAIGGYLIRVERLDLPPNRDMHESERAILHIRPDILIGKLSANMALQDRVAKLLAAGNVQEAKWYDYQQYTLCASEGNFGQMPTEIVEFLEGYYGK